jgi:hypothetical protein
LVELSDECIGLCLVRQGCRVGHSSNLENVGRWC